MPTLFVVGDSTLASFNDTTYYYPRYGYATQLYNFFNNELIIKNYALSGRSSRSFMNDSNYELFKNEIKKGDFLLIGFGHNDEKADDVARFSSANKPLSDSSSFKYVLYKNYIEIALKKGAIPIISTPVSRLASDNKYEGIIIHDTNNGNYKDAILELGKELNIDAIDLTTPTMNLYKEIGYDKALFHHAITQGIKINNEIKADVKAIDKTHLNIYGAKYVAYFFANAIKNTNSKLKKYLNDDIIKPTVEKDLIMNPNFKYHDYVIPKLDSNIFYNTTIGEMNPNDNEIELKDNRIILKNKTNKGKFIATSDTFNYYFKQINKKYNFNIEVKAKILNIKFQKQAGFGIMIRDDIYFNDNFVLASNFISCGILTLDESIYLNFWRDNPTEISHDKFLNKKIKEEDEFYFKISRLGQRINISLIFNGIEYNNEFLDFDLTSKDISNIYAGIFVAKNMEIEFSDLKIDITTLAMEA